MQFTRSFYKFLLLFSKSILTKTSWYRNNQKSPFPSHTNQSQRIGPPGSVNTLQHQPGLTGHHPHRSERGLAVQRMCPSGSHPTLVLFATCASALVVSSCKKTCFGRPLAASTLWLFLHSFPCCAQIFILIRLVLLPRALSAIAL